jgi:uncharacterized membrane protein YheB (UPF0754 family)
MVEEKKLEGLENQESLDKKLDQSIEKETDSEKELTVEKKEVVSDDEKRKEAQEKIQRNVFNEKPAVYLKKQTDDLKNLNSIEEKIEKLLEVAVHYGPQKAIKLAQELNSNYALDNMHDKMIDEEELNKKMQEKGFI